MVREGLTVNENTISKMKARQKRVICLENRFSLFVVARRAMRVCLVLMGVLLCAMPLLRGRAAAVEVKGDILENALWTSKLSPYEVTGNITVAEGALLTIEPGVTVEFKKVTETADGYHIQVHGTLDAQGTVSKPIIFTTEERGWYWGHIEFAEESTPWDDTNATGCILSGCIIEYAGKGAAGGYSRASIRSISSSPLISDCIVRYGNADGILCNAGVPNILGNRIHDTTCGIMLINPEGGRVENNYLIENGQGIYLDSGSGTLSIQNNTIRGTEPEIYGACMGVKLSFLSNLESYFWEQIAGTPVTITDPNTTYPTFTAPDLSADETLTFQLTVTDRYGLLASDTVTVLVRGENEAPEADAGPDQTVFEGEQVVLDGSNSIDPDGSVLTYTWKQTSKYPDPAVTLSDPNSAHCTFTAPSGVGEHGKLCIFELTVTDIGDSKSWDTVIIKVVEDTTNAAPVADAGAELGVTEGSPVTLNGSGSYDPDPNGEIISWLWSQIEGTPVAISNPTSDLAGFTAPEVGWDGNSLIFELTVTDDAFQESSDRVIVNVLDADPNNRNNPPQADANDVVVNEGTSVRVDLDGIVYDPDGIGDIDTYNWVQVSGPTVTINGAGEDRYFTAPNVTKDEVLVFRFTITDDHGLKSSAKSKVTIKWVNEPPVANAGTNQTVVEGVKVLLNGSASSDPDDGIASYLWEQIGGTAVTLTSTAVPRPFFTAPAVDADEQIIFRLTVYDGEGENSLSYVTVKVTAENMQPVADAGDDRAVLEGTVVYLDGSGSYDPEDPNDPNGIVSYLWEQDPNVGQHVTLDDADTTTPHFSAPSLSDPNAPPFISLAFRLTVWDKGDREAMDSVIINVTADPNGNQVPDAQAGPDQTVAAGATAILDGSGSFDPDYPCEIMVNMNSLFCDDPNRTGNIIAIAKNTGTNCVLDITSNNLYKTSGNFTVYLFNWATGDTGTPDMTDNWWGDASASVIEAMIYDADYDVRLPQVDASSPQGAAITGAGSSLSYPPMADAGEDQTAGPDERVTLDGSGTYDPNDILTCQWTQVEGKGVTLANAGGKTASFIAPEPEEETEGEDGEETPNTLTFRLTVTDAGGFYDTDEVTVTLGEGDTKAELMKSSGCFISILNNTHDLF